MEKKQKKAEYMREYRKRKAKVLADVEKEEKKQLDEILKHKQISMADWIRQHIKNDYQKLNKQ